MTTVRRLVVDVLKPHDPPLVEFTEQVADVDSVGGVTASLIELDQEVQNIRLTFEGEAIEFEAIEQAVEHLGGAVHSVDQVSCGESVVMDHHAEHDSP